MSAIFDGFIPEGMPLPAPTPTGDAVPPGAPAAPTGAPAEPGTPHADPVNPWLKPGKTQTTPGAPAAPSAPAAPAAPSMPPGADIESINRVIDNMQLTADFDVAELTKDMDEGAAAVVQKVADGMQGVARKIFMQSMLATRRMNDQLAERMKKEASSHAQNNMRFNSAQTLLESKLPTLKDPAYAPIAQASLSQFLNQGMSMEAAVDRTVQYFQQMSGNLNKHFTGQNPNARPGGMPGGFGTPHMETVPGFQGASDEPDWLELFGGVGQ